MSTTESQGLDRPTVDVQYGHLPGRGWQVAIGVWAPSFPRAAKGARSGLVFPFFIQYRLEVSLWKAVVKTFLSSFLVTSAGRKQAREEQGGAA